jgi:predicted XRE-type DNA-binding protein
MKRKLPLSTIQEIRHLYKTRRYKQAYLACVYGVSCAQISRIVNLKRRKMQ